MAEKQLKEQIDDIHKFVEKMDEVPPIRTFSDKLTGKNKPKKEFKLAGRIRAGWKSKLKKNYVLIFRVRTNGEVIIHFAPINNEMVYIEDIGTYHMANTEFMLRYKNFPAIILPEWSLKPLSLSEHFKKTTEKQESALPQKVIINAMKMAGLKPSMAMRGKTILWVLAAAVAGLYLLSQIIGK